MYEPLKTARWHEQDCTRPDVALVDGGISCWSCGAVPDAHSVPESQLLSLPPIEISQSGLNLRWPGSVVYSNISDAEHCEEQSPAEDQSASFASDPRSSDPRSAEPEIASSFTHPAYADSLKSNEIRLLRLHAGSGEDPVHATFVAGRIKDVPKYEAVSYTWADEFGDLWRSKRMFLGKFWDILFVTSNCEAALKRLRHEKSDRLLWIDAVCINQEDRDERSHQVGLMRDIYSGADKVLAFVGQSSEDSDHAVMLINYGAEFLTDVEKVALRNFFNRPYFQRLWVVQETVLSKSLEIYCGGRPAICCMTGDFRWKLFVQEGLAPAWIQYLQAGTAFEPQDSIALLATTESCRFSDPRDRVFGLLGLIKDIEKHGLEPDYSLSAREVLIGIAAFLVQRHRLLADVLNHASSGTRVSELPSWVPDWSSRIGEGVIRSRAARFIALGSSGSYKHERHLLVESFKMPRNPRIPVVSTYHLHDYKRGSSRPTFVIDRRTGLLEVTAARFCDFSQESVSATEVDGIGRLVFVWDRGRSKAPITFIPAMDITLDPRYCVFFVAGTTKPVILRQALGGRYSCVSTCGILLKEEGFDNGLGHIDTAEVREPIISRAEYMFSAIGYQKTATWTYLWDDWLKTERRISWIYRDPHKLRQLALELERGDEVWTVEKHAGQVLALLVSLLDTYPLSPMQMSAEIRPPAEHPSRSEKRAYYDPEELSRFNEIRSWADDTEDLLDAFGMIHEYGQPSVYEMLSGWDARLRFLDGASHIKRSLFSVEKIRSSYDESWYDWSLASLVVQYMVSCLTGHEDDVVAEVKSAVDAVKLENLLWSWERFGKIVELRREATRRFPDVEKMDIEEAATSFLPFEATTSFKEFNLDHFLPETVQIV
ncbi:hypothetical protein NKR23_g11400 [Pleurostoma richardsiae]|uniref:Heterokaryon incompatibility domain-containing protein n=1 Tax=Pleurostoma richardsiae TaxID=41990 RepID=A0AA38RAB2_9PEZI|nr:hypothetical protein NKR23_g11400 [Pleurostoma richardsiae]